METDFGWALAKMRDGYSVRRAAWPKDKAMALADSNTRIRWSQGVRNVVLFTDETLLAYDWELANV